MRVFVNQNLVCYTTTMPLTFLQLNIEEGRFQEDIYAYVKKHDFDILHFQEVTSGEHNKRGLENFPEIKKELGYEGIQSIYWRLKEDTHTYMSNATFFKSSLKPLSSKEVFLKPFELLSREQMKDYPSHAASLLDVVFQLDSTPVHFINTHLVWGPTPEDKPYKLEQGKVLHDYIRSLREPFLLSGDFNVTPQSEIVTTLDTLAINHVVHAGITNTLNPQTHRVQSLFPKGLAVDFLYTASSLRVSDFTLVDTPNLSDHYGLSLTINDVVR